MITPKCQNTDGGKKKIADAAIKKAYEHKKSRLAALFVLIRKPHRNNPTKLAATPPKTIGLGLTPKASERAYSICPSKRKANIQEENSERTMTDSLRSN